MRPHARTGLEIARTDARIASHDAHDLIQIRPLPGKECQDCHTLPLAHFHGASSSTSAILTTTFY